VENLGPRVYRIIAERLQVDEASITAASRLEDDLGEDSLDMVELVMTFEEVFKLEIPDNEVEALKTAGDVVEYLNSRLA
jgi:acyl carrier protein